MNANTIISDDMTLEQKLAAIDLAMKNAQEQAQEEAQSQGRVVAPVDPGELLACDGCQ